MPRRKRRGRAESSAWLTIKEAAQRAGLSPFTIYKMRSGGKLPVKTRKIGGEIRVDRAAFEGWARKRADRPRRGRPPGAGRVRRGRRPSGRAVRRRAARRAFGGVRGGAFNLPLAAGLGLDFWFRLLRFVRDRAGRVTIQTDGASVSLVRA